MSVLFISYPKSGRTWIRFMVNSYICKLNNLSFANVFHVEKLLAPEQAIIWSHLSGAMILNLPYYQLNLEKIFRPYGWQETFIQPWHRPFFI